MQAKEIVQMEKKRNDVRKETYKAMLDQFSRKIKTSSILGNKYCVLSVPPFLVGFPKYDIAKAVVYMCRQLQRLGYIVNLVGPLDIKVEWHKRPEPTVEQEIETPDMYFPSLVNLHKAAGKIRVQKKGK